MTHRTENRVGLCDGTRKGATTVSEQNVELAVRAYRAANANDIKSFLAVMHPEVEFQSSGVYPDISPAYRGIEGAVNYWKAVRTVWQDFEVEIKRVEDRGDRVLVLLHQHVRGRDGIPAEHAWGHLFSFADGLVRTVRAYASWEEALEALGPVTEAGRD
jgi:ketosteroid isomerase-like protein